MSYRQKYLKYKTKYLELKGKCKLGTEDDSSCPSKDFNCLIEEQDEDKYGNIIETGQKCVNKNGQTLLEYLKKTNLDDQTEMKTYENVVEKAKLPHFLKKHIIGFNSCKQIIKYLETNSEWAKKMTATDWKYLSGKIQLPHGSNFELRPPPEKGKDPWELYKKENSPLHKQQFIGKSICGNIENEDTKHLCKTFIAKCMYKHLYDKYKSVNKNAWYEAILKNNTYDLKLFGYFVDTTIIDENAFSTYTRRNHTIRKNKLTSVIIPNSVHTIGTDAFSGNALSSVTIPDSVIWIGQNAFNHNQLTSLIIPNSVKTISHAAFANNLLESVIIKDSLPEKSSQSYLSIGSSAFANNKLKQVEFSNRMIHIGTASFKSNLLTNGVPIPDNVYHYFNYSESNDSYWKNSFDKGVRIIKDGGTYDVIE
jgi:hypothetical protein